MRNKKQMASLERKAHTLAALAIREYAHDLPWRARALKGFLLRLASEHEQTAEPVEYLKGLVPWPLDKPDPLEPLFVRENHFTL